MLILPKGVEDKNEKIKVIVSEFDVILSLLATLYIKQCGILPGKFVSTFVRTS